MCPPYPQRDRKRRLNGAVCRNHRIKRVVPCRCRTGTLKNPTKCLWRWEPDRRYNFFFNPPAHLCRHIYDWNIVNCDVKQPIYPLPYFNQIMIELINSRNVPDLFKDHLHPSVLLFCLTSTTFCPLITQTLRIISVRCIPLSLRSKTRRRATLLLPTWICSCQSVGTVNFALPFTTNVTISIPILQTFRSWVATSHLHPPMAFLSHNSSDTQGLAPLMNVLFWGRCPRGDAGGLSREYVLRIPSVS